VFDPIGVLSPVLVEGIVLLQHLRSKIDWDDTIVDDKTKDKLAMDWKKISTYKLHRYI
jgi:hypothetical protein